MNTHRNQAPVANAPLGAVVVLTLAVAAAPVGAQPATGAATDVVVHAKDLPASALSEFRVAKEPGSPGGVLVFTPNTGGELDPPPENDPHVTLKVKVQAGVPYRFWIHMKVGTPKGKSKANLVFAQFTDAIDAAGQETLRPRTGSYLNLRGPAKPGWAWVGHDAAKPDTPMPVVRFKTGGEVTVRLQAGMEGVAFDQVVLSPARFLEKAPTEAVVAK
jgi:hypothetical protein